MKLLDLLLGTALENGPASVHGKLGLIQIKSVTCRAQDTGPGGIFIAIKGNAADGHDYIGQAFEKGAAAVVAQKIPKDIPPDQAERIIRVKDSRKACADIAARFYGHPSREMVLVGITGTNGKTTTSWILESIFKSCGFSCGVIGTVNIRYMGKTFDNPITTPDAVELQKILFKMKQAGVTHAVMEVSSHALDQYRVEGCEFDAGIYTNLTQDHLDYHGTMEEYFACKKRFFTDFLGSASPNNAPAIINQDDGWGKKLAGSLSCDKILVSHTHEAQVWAPSYTDEITGLSGTIALGKETLAFSSELTGRFNLENILVSAGAALCLGIDPRLIIQGIKDLPRVPGRLEKLTNSINRHIFVDYAHTPDALASVLDTLSKRAPGRIITVFGCGGDRDRTKRGPMGKIACRYSDLAIITSDNPRTEAPEAIVDDIIKGVKEDGAKLVTENCLAENPHASGYLRETDREKALELAVRISRPSDIILAAGKGHETYQITNTGTIHFDDKEKLEAACKKHTKGFTPMGWSVDDLSSALGQRPVTKVSAGLFTGISTDSRTIEPGQVFIALKGDSFDGHCFIAPLMDKGITAFITEKGYTAGLDAHLARRIEEEGITLFETRDTLEALGALARYHRIRSNVKLLAITGSNGKTTTRKMAQKIFSTRFNTLATRGNFNNEVGMPLTLLKLSPLHEWAVIEMGMNHRGEISRLSKIATPDIAIVTNTSGAHLEGLKTAENVARAKAEIFESMGDGGTAIIFADDPRREILESHARKNNAISNILFFGWDKTADLSAHNLEIDGQTASFAAAEKGKKESYSICSPAPFMVNNALAAILAAKAADIPVPCIREGLKAFTPVSGRMNIKTLPNGIHMIDDTYNANPASMAQALKTLDQMSARPGIAVLGDMLELGPDSDRLHREAGHLAAELKPGRIFLFGRAVAHLKAGALEMGFPEEKIFMGTKDEIAVQLKECAKTIDWILLKGSRGMAMETLIPTLTALEGGR